MERRYDIGHGVTIRDNGVSFIADWSTSPSCAHSIGINRPSWTPLPELVRVQYNHDRSMYYLPDCCKSVRAWASTETFPERPMNCDGYGVFSPQAVEIIDKSWNVVYWRKLWPFSSWKVSEGECQDLPNNDVLVLDYLMLNNSDALQQERRFNKAIEFTGRDFNWIANKIGPWVPVEEPPIVKLED